MSAVATIDLLTELNATGWDAGVFYPMVETPPMESEWHAFQLTSLYQALAAYFAHAHDIVVLADVPLYYERGNPHRFVVPDCYVTLDVQKQPLRRSFFAWAEGKYPDFILELLSDHTRQYDLVEKMQLYEQVFQTPEYFHCDPESQSITGHRLVGGAYQKLSPDDAGRVWSRCLGLGFGMIDGWLRLYRLDGSLIPTMEELLRGS